MSNLLETLWNEYICPKLEKNIQREEVIEALALLSRNEKALNERLNDKEKELFEKYRGCADELRYYNELDAFISGVWLGSGVTSEALNSK